MKRRILYFHLGYSSFVVKDIRLLGVRHSIREHHFRGWPKYRMPLSFAGQLLFLLRRIWQADVLVCQFAGYHSFFPCLIGRLFRIPTLVIPGGTDCVSFPSIGYGNFSRKLLGTFTEWSYRLATHIAPVHESLIEYDYTYQDEDYPRQGLRYFCKNLRTPCTVVHNGYDAGSWHSTAERETNSFITVTAGYSRRIKKLKGIDLILEVAPLFPQCRFYILGVQEGQETSASSPNVVFLPPVPNGKLADFYSKAEFYMQLSLSEGFPNALSEAMLCGCIPLGSAVGAIPDIIRESGFILHRRDAGALEKLIRKALAAPRLQLGGKARAIIRDSFSEERRRQGLERIIGQLVKQ